MAGLKLKTKDGQDITFKLYEDIEGDNNRGFIVHKIVPIVGGNPAGYLKVSYIPNDRAKKHYPTVFHWLERMEGKHGMITVYEDKSISDPKALFSLLQRYGNWREGAEASQQWKNGELTKSDLKEFRKKILTNLQEKYEDHFKQFLQYFVDNPYVDYINVDEKRNHVGLALYIAGAYYLYHNFGRLKLFASSTQSNDAQNAWAYLKKIFQVRTKSMKWYDRTVRRVYLYWKDIESKVKEMS